MKKTIREMEVQKTFKGTLLIPRDMSYAKKLGQFFTPEVVANFMVGLIGKDKNVEILEPCAGKGIFLKVLTKNGYDNVAAYEIDSNLDNQSSIAINYADFLSIPTTKKFDVIIGNPPYVRWKNISPEIKENFLKNEYWADKINGLSDLLYAFIYKCVDMLKEGGELIFITPSFWTSTLHSSLLRKHMLQFGDIEKMIWLDEMKVFDGVSTSTLIFKYVKNKINRDVAIVDVKSKLKISSDLFPKINSMLSQLNARNIIDEKKVQAFLVPQFSNSNPWKPIPEKTMNMIRKIENECQKNPPMVEVNGNRVPLIQLLSSRHLKEMDLEPSDCIKVVFAGKNYFYPIEENQRLNRYISLGDIAEIGNGLVSGLDKAFNAESHIIPNEERNALVNVVKAHNITQFFVNEFSKYVFLNQIGSENEFRQNYPEIYASLIRYKESLLKRYSYETEIPWWHWIFLRNYDLISNTHTKIICPCKERIDVKGHVRFAYTEENALVTQDATLIVKKPIFREDALYVLALLNSRITFLWIKYKGLNRGGVTEFSEEPLSQIPIRLIDWNNETEKNSYEHIVDLTERLLQSRDLKTYKPLIDKEIEGLYNTNINSI